MTRLRDAAALFVEAGRSLGMAEECWQTELWLRDVLGEATAEPDVKPPAERLAELVERVHTRRRVAEAMAVTAQQRAQAVLNDHEHPGARLARRLLRAAHAARAGWREPG